jgi:lysophospholipase
LFFGEAGLFASYIEDIHVAISDGVQIRVAHFFPKVPSSEVLVVFQGRESFMEKNEKFYRMLSGDPHDSNNPFVEKPLDIWVIDARGRGQSGGRLPGLGQRDHIEDFDQYLKDFHEIIEGTIRPEYRNKNVNFNLFGFSLGGHLALRYTQMYPDHPFKKQFLVAPMIQFKSGSIPLWVAKPVSKMICCLGFGTNYAFGQGDINPDTLKFENERSHHDPVAFQKTVALLKDHKDWVIGGATFGWVNAAFQSIDESLSPRNLEVSKKNQTYFFVPGEDSIVDPWSALDLSNRLNLPSSRIHFYPGSWHQIIRELPEYFNPFLKDLYGAVYL